MVSTKEKVKIRKVNSTEKIIINEIVEIHLQTFQGFFLTFLGRGFLRQLYKGYTTYEKSALLVALNDENNAVGFLAYSENISGFYKYLIKTKLIQFAWYSLCAFFRKPSAIIRLLKAFSKPGETERKEDYIELASIGVSPKIKANGVGSALIDELKTAVDFKKFKYICLETDAEDNKSANNFYLKNGFILFRSFVTSENRKMNEYRYTNMVKSL
ncbi:MAG: GNAT family N-acetyltransferase [Clostridia bacterium]